MYTPEQIRAAGMTKQEALNALADGELLTHIYFDPHEFIREEAGYYFDEKNNRMNIQQFWDWRTSKSWDNGWSIFNKAALQNKVSDISAEEVLKDEDQISETAEILMQSENLEASIIILKQFRQEYASIVNERKDSAGSSYNTNDIDLAYLTGAFNVGGMDGLSQEIKRIKKLGKQPHDIIDFCKKYAAELHNDESQPKKESK